MRLTPSSSSVKTAVYAVESVKRRPRELSLPPLGSIPRIASRSGLEGSLGADPRESPFFRGFDHVTDAAHRVDQLRREAIVDLAAQMPDVDVHDIGQAVVIDRKS